jgi:hypothetical protein
VSFVLAAAILAWGAHDKPMLRLDVTFSRNACCSWQVWVNSSADITVLPIFQGAEQSYSVPLSVERIHDLHIPLGQVKGMTATLRDIRVTRGSHTVAEVDPGSLPITPYFARRHLTPHGVAFTSTYTQPSISVPVSLDTHEGKLRLLVARIASGPLRTIMALLLFGVIVATLVALRSRKQAIWLASILLTLGLIRALPWLSYRLQLRDSVRDAVGFASYQGLWKKREQFVFDGAVALAILVPVALLGITRQITRPGPAAYTSVPSGVSKRLAALMIASPVIVLALASVPNIRLFIGPPPQYAPSWDNNNFVFWMYLIQKFHSVPMRDFFWPYGFQSLYDAALPWGQTAMYLTSLSFWIFLAFGSYLALSRFFSRRGLVMRYLVLTGFWLSVTLAGYWSFTIRYGAPLAVVLLFVGVRANDRLFSTRRLVFALAWVELVLLEPAQAIYASVPIIFLLLVDVFTNVQRARIAVLGWAGRNFVMLAIPTAAAIGVYVATGEFHGTVDYYEHLGTVSSQVALPGYVDGWVTNPTSTDSFLLWSVPIGLVLGMTGLLSSRDRSRDPSPAVIALALLAFMIMQKQVLRPSIAPQIWLPVVFALIFWVLTESRLDPIRHWSTIAAGAGGIAAMILVAGGYHSGWKNLRSGPDRLSNSVEALLHQRAALSATAHEAFVPAAFSRFDAYKPVVRELSQTPSVRRGKPVWILGDDTPITMMLGLRWPYYYNDLYNTSPLRAQEKVLSGLRNSPPGLVAWDFASQAMTFDSVPHVVRVPLLFQWAVGHLVPERIIGTYAILRPRRRGEKVPLAWWRRRIGTAVNLGHIPIVADLPPLQCVNTKPSCGSYLVVTIPTTTPIPVAFEYPISVDGLPFSLQFAAAPGVRRYVIPLDRLWFWRPDDTQAVRIVPTGTINNVQVNLVRRLVDPNVLY